jgi:hypothetical protein
VTGRILIAVRHIELKFESPWHICTYEDLPAAMKIGGPV